MPPSFPPDQLNAVELQRLTTLLTPPAFYMRIDDNIRISSFCSLGSIELVVRWRMLQCDGTIVVSSDRHVPNSNRTVASTVIFTGEGWLLGVEVFASVGSPRIGQCYTVVDVIHGDQASPITMQCLLQGYVTDTSRRSWPTSPLQQSTDGAGVLRSITGTDPAANTEISEAVPTNARWRVHAIQFSLVTDANAANREVALTFDDGTLVFARVPSGFAHIASTTAVYSAFFDAQRNTVAQDTTHNIPLPRLDLQGGFRFNTVTTNRQAGDNYGPPQYLVEEWIED